MKTSQISVLLFISFLFCGCKKEATQNNTIDFQPLSYLPVYPGSYWKFTDGNDTSILRTSDSLIFFDGKYLTSLGGTMIWGYLEQYDNGPVGGSGWVLKLSETVGTKIIRMVGDPRYNPSRHETIVLEKKKDQFGDSVIIQKTVIFSGQYPYLVPGKIWIYEIYKKNVGLCFRCGIDSVTQDTAFKTTLNSFFINRHWQK